MAKPLIGEIVKISGIAEPWNGSYGANCEANDSLG
jgi:hypothetical protein